MKRLIAVIGVALLAVCARQAPVAIAGEQDALDKVEYFPLKVGTTWEYLANGKKIVTTVAAHEQLAEKLFAARLETTMDGVIVTEHLTVMDGGVCRILANGQKVATRINGQQVTKPWLVLKVAPKVGDKWEFVMETLPIQGSLLTLEAKKLKVGSKEYDTFLVTSSNMKFAGQDVELKTWYAKDVGMVKQTFVQPGAGLDITLELDKFTPGK
jgi:hypothetical protein